MNEYEQALLARVGDWVDAHTAEMVEDIKRLVAVRSVTDRESSVKPYGQGCRDAVDTAMRVCEDYGFTTKNNDYYSCTAHLPGRTDKRIGIFCHLDVVPEGSGWSKDPYEPYVQDGYIVGRGSRDNKGPAIASLYTMRCLRDLGLTLDHSLMLYFGCAEETGMEDIEHFLARNEAPVFSYTPDASYSVCYGEKGVLQAQFSRNLEGGNLVDFHGGQISNAVADHAEAVLSGLSLEAVRQAVAHNDRLSAAAEGERIRVTATGSAAHAAFPEGSANAIQLLAKALADGGLVTGPALEAMQFIAAALEENYGHGLDIAFEDDISGPTTCIGGVAWMQDGIYVQDINVRYAITADVQELERRLRARCGACGFAVTLFEDNKPTYTPKDSRIVEALDDAVRVFYGDRFAPYVMGGGTYARKLPNAVAFGPGTRGKSPFGGGHQPDEGVHIETLLTAIQVYALALTRLDRLV